MTATMPHATANHNPAAAILTPLIYHDKVITARTFRRMVAASILLHDARHRPLPDTAYCKTVPLPHYFWLSRHCTHGRAARRQSHPGTSIADCCNIAIKKSGHMVRFQFNPPAPQTRCHESYRPVRHRRSCDISVRPAGPTLPIWCNSRPALRFARDTPSGAS